jgi:ribonuclease HII
MASGPTLQRESSLRSEGYRAIAGVDEAGRGALAGPVVAGVAILPLDSPTLEEELLGIRDSKVLSAERRAFFYDRIVHSAAALGVGLVGQAALDEMGVALASKLAMSRALDNLTTPPDYLLVDGFPLEYHDIPYESIVGGDDLCFSIAAASIVAKVVRDQIMITLHRVFPGYAFDQHKGYGTAQHREALSRLGPCAIHRLSFAPLRSIVQQKKPARKKERGRMPLGSRRLGQLGEGLAAQHLEEQGYAICERNYRCSVGEIDIVALDGECLAFVEVRTRKSKRFGSPEESVTNAKKQKLVEVAQTYLQEHESLPLDWRIDVVSVELSRRGKLERLELFKNAVEG